MKTEKAAAMDMYFDNEASIVLDIMFILGSLLCRCGAELMENNLISRFANLWSEHEIYGGMPNEKQRIGRDRPSK